MNPIIAQRLRDCHAGETKLKKTLEDFSLADATYFQLHGHHQGKLDSHERSAKDIRAYLMSWGEEVTEQTATSISDTGSKEDMSFGGEFLIRRLIQMERDLIRQYRAIIAHPRTSTGVVKLVKDDLLPRLAAAPYKEVAVTPMQGQVIRRAAAAA